MLDFPRGYISSLSRQNLSNFFNPPQILHKIIVNKELQ